MRRWLGLGAIAALIAAAACSSFAGSDVPAGTDAGADATAVVPPSPADGAPPPDADATAPPYCDTVADAAYCEDFDLAGSDLGLRSTWAPGVDRLDAGFLLEPPGSSPPNGLAIYGGAGSSTFACVDSGEFSLMRDPASPLAVASIRVHVRMNLDAVDSGVTLTRFHAGPSLRITDLGGQEHCEFFLATTDGVPELDYDDTGSSSSKVTSFATAAVGRGSWTSIDFTLEPSVTGTRVRFGAKAVDVSSCTGTYLSGVTLVANCSTASGARAAIDDFTIWAE